MKSYASIDRFEGNFVVCEVELILVQDSLPEDYSKFTVMTDYPLEELNKTVSEAREGDILVVEHDSGKISYVYYKDDIEKSRRIEVLRKR